MKNIFKIFIASLIIYSCTKDNSIEKQTYLYKSETLNFTELINNNLVTVNKISENENRNDFIHSEFETTLYIPEELTQKEKENYLLENKDLISGNLKYFINDNIFIEIEFLNGDKVHQANYSSASILSFLQQSDPYPKRNECSYEGIQQCAQYTIYETWTTIEALICSATGGLGCITIVAAACTEKNCFT